MSSILCLVVVALVSSAAAYNISGPVTVSGLSAGAFMAVQYHVAYSSQVAGAAVFAGGPFYCAQNMVEYALTSCMSTPFLLDIDPLIKATASFAQDGSIDPVAGIKNDRVFLYSGTGDTVVKTDVVKKAGDYYVKFGAQVSSVFNISSEHCIPTVNYGNSCGDLGSPYINKCDFDGAGAALQYLFNRKLNAPTTPVSNNFVTIDQTKYFPNGDSVSGLNDQGYVYVPSACQNGASCALHIDFHGCNQDPDQLGMTYVQHAGYADWAETNNIIVLFPQAKEEMPSNMEGCFDWWGYGSSDYATQKGPQMATVKAMADALSK
eukprot:comp19532_c0_seq1/m.37193 comp19532_c0_seq1/g.37193  ORF comp19532_c0_seq1/g.37193 comp19532_c0_seq1/m.37193 type:complete len:320 (-) comp19532_c0_seq1:76-1035(-)